MSYQAGVDVGATFSAVASCRSAGGTAPEIVPLAERSAFLPTVVIANPDGSVVVGDDAERLAQTDPQRVVRQFTRRIGDGVPILAGGVSMPAELLAARFVIRMLDSVAIRLGGPATAVTITHPAGWRTHRVAALRDALAGQGLFGTRFVPAPVAAALAHATRERIEPGTSVAVYDLGGSTFEATVVRRDTMDRFEVAGDAGDLELGGLDLDDMVFAHVTSALGSSWDELDPTGPTVRGAVSALRRACTAAKEALSADTEVLIPVALPGIDTRIRLGRAEFEEAIRPAIEETVDALERAIAAAGVEPAAVLLTGGSARIPLITQLVSERLDRPVSVAWDPKGIVALGAAIDARGPLSPPTRMLPQPAPLPIVDAPVLVPPPLRPPRADDSGRWLGLPRLVVATVAATVLAAGVTGGLTLLARHTAPASSDADTGQSPKTTARENPPVPDPPAVREKPPTTTTQPTRTRKPEPASQPPRTTTTTPTTKSPPPTKPSTGTTTTTSPSTRASAP